MKVCEIFYSIQGEGRNTGKPATFIRFYGCNLTCSFCDEPLHKTFYISMTEEEILEKISSFPSKFVILTGGEPSLFDLNEFARLLQSKGYYVAVETNGFKPENIRDCDWITYSPKEWENSNQSHFDDFFHELKIIIHKEVDVSHLLDITQGINKPVYLQPQADQELPNAENTKFCVELVKKFPQFHLSLQTHKLINEP